MTDVAPGIVTFGLGSGPDAMIIGNVFNLGFFRVDVGVGSPIIPPAPPPPRDGGGGSRPLAPGEIQNFFKVVDNQYQLLPTLLAARPAEKQLRHQSVRLQAHIFYLQRY